MDQRETITLAELMQSQFARKMVHQMYGSLEEESKLLTLEDISRMYKVSIRTARDVIVRTPGFPQPVPGSKRNRRWLADTIHAYLSGKIPQELRINA